MRIHQILAGFLVVSLCGFGATVQGQTPRSTTEADPMRFTTAAITLKVPRFTEARQQILDAARHNGAELLDAKTMVKEDGRQHGWVRLRLDADHLPALLTTLRQTGILYAEKVGSTENLSEYQSLDRRAERLKEHQARLSSLLNNQRRLRGSDILYVQERLFRAGVDESLLQQRRTDMTRRRQVATIEVALFEPLSVRRLDHARIDLAAHFNEAKGYAGGVLSGFARRVATVAAYAAVFAPFWVPVALLVLLLLRWLVRRRVPATLWEALLAVGAWGIGAAQTVGQVWRAKTATMGIPDMVPVEPATGESHDGSPASGK
jgi:hypothetical protein